MKKSYGALLLASMLSLTLSAASHLNKSQNSVNAITFEQHIGGREVDIAKSVIVLEDGYLVVGQSKSFSKNRFFNVYVIKIDKNV